MIIETLENGDYITLEKDCTWDPPYYYQILEIYKRYDKNNNFICSWWEYVPVPVTITSMNKSSMNIKKGNYIPVDT